MRIQGPWGSASRGGGDAHPLGAAVTAVKVPR